MCVVVLIDSGVFQDFAFRADITVLLRHVGELVDAIQVRRLPLGIFFHPNVTCDAALIEPLQHFPIAVGGIGCHPLWPPTISFAVAIDHIACRCTLLTQPGGRRLYSNDHTAFIVDQIVIEVTQFGSAISLGQVR